MEADGKVMKENENSEEHDLVRRFIVMALVLTVLIGGAIIFAWKNPVDEKTQQAPAIVVSSDVPSQVPEKKDEAVIVVEKGANANFLPLTAVRPAMVPDTDFGAQHQKK